MPLLRRGVPHLLRRREREDRGVHPGQGLPRQPGPAVHQGPHGRGVPLRRPAGGGPDPQGHVQPADRARLEDERTLRQRRLPGRHVGRRHGDRLQHGRRGREEARGKLRGYLPVRPADHGGAMAGQHLLQGRPPVEQHRGQRPDVHDLGRDGLHPQPGQRPPAGELLRYRRGRLHQPLGPQRARVAPRAVLARGRHQGEAQHPDHGGRPALHRDHGRLRADQPHQQPVDHHPPQRRPLAPERHRPRPDEGVSPGRGRGLHPPAHGRVRRLPGRHHGPLQPGAGHRPHGDRSLRGQADSLDLGGRHAEGQTPQERRRPLLLGDRVQPVAPRTAPQHQHHQPPPADREHRPAGRRAVLHDGTAQRHERAPDGRPDRKAPVQRGHQERRAPQEDKRGLGPASRDGSTSPPTPRTRA